MNKGVGKGGGEGIKPPLLILPKCIIIVKQEREKQLSHYKQCHIQKSKLRSVQIWIRLSLCATNLILKAKLPHFSKVVYALDEHCTQDCSLHSLLQMIKDNPYLPCSAAIKFYNITYSNIPYRPSSCTPQFLHTRQTISAMFSLVTTTVHINMHSTPSTTYHTAFHNPPLHTTNKHKAVVQYIVGKMAQDVGMVGKCDDVIPI